MSFRYEGETYNNKKDFIESYGMIFRMKGFSVDEGERKAKELYEDEIEERPSKINRSVGRP